MTPVPAALALVIREGQVLLVRRANAPDRGLWGFPGGRIKGGESVFAAAERELREETGVEARATRLIEAVDVFDRGADGVLQRHFILLVVSCDWEAGDPLAADDACDATWFMVSALRDANQRFSANVARLSRQAALGWALPRPAKGLGLWEPFY